ncbi:MAG: AAA family ATPase [Simkaniaceae bacterium]
MRIAVSGTHFSGKSTLIESLLEYVPHYLSVDEPYFLLEEEGYEFSDPPILEDYEAQLERSIVAIQESQKNTLFDRCPFDCLAYMLASGEVDLENWIPRVKGGIKRLDLIIFVPIEHRDRIPVPFSEDLKLRMLVDEKLQELLFYDSLGILDSIEVLEVTGSLESRVKMVKTFLS